ncbi:MAG: Leucine--tRNA ligase [Candidatus Heimdallarchaeota archaeon LC_2]|nr:MAG: Leucine--tRNA ligase [Candidatus Heimdallarchaeota archaeon LC_2]
MTQELSEHTYDAKSTEAKWQKLWNEAKIFEADYDKNREKYHINFPFPYVNGSPHLGHGYSFMKAEIMARYQRMLGKNVLFPFAFHATGEPIAGMAKRVNEGDESQINALIMSGVPKKEIPKFKESEHIIRYFVKQWTDTTKILGASIDWRRKFITTQLTPVFSKFVEWQYRKLKADGYVVQGSHPVIWCPRDQNPTGDHDRLEGVGVRIVDFTLIKFKSQQFDAFFLPATLRPETTFGVTNMFVNPNARYIRVEMDGQWYIIGKNNLIKFQDQQHNIGKVQDIDMDDLIGSTMINPVTEKEIMVLPGEFIDADGSTGVVMSVPGHAPMDWIVLEELKRNPTSLSKWGITPEEINAITPISLIKVEGYGEFPAGEEIANQNVLSMEDPNVKIATKIIYRKEFNSGILKDIYGKYKGKGVSEVKEEMVSDFTADGIAFNLKEPSDLVVCRCRTRNHVKYLENQWFLKFGDPVWKQQVHEMLDGMDVFPEEARLAFHNTIDWLENKACARRSGLGTPVPWDNEWIVETLSDSVIYMSYYIISKYVNDGTFRLEFANDAVFNYLLLGKGRPKALSEKYSIDVELLKEIRREMKYFYGFDLRTSGKDLLMNHLTYMLMHHRAIFPEPFWPKGVAVNGFVAIVKPGQTKGEKMSKSKGNFKTIVDVVDSFGVDATRLGFAIAGEGMKDAQFALSEADSYNRWLENIFEMAFEDVDDGHEYQIDRWLISRIQNQITKTRGHFERMETRLAFQSAHHELLQDLKWYLRRRKLKGPAYKYAVRTIISMITPFAPHIAEEIWEKWGNKGFACNSEFPISDQNLIDEDAENAEKFLINFFDDMRGLKTFLVERNNPEPKNIQIFVSSEWKYKVYQKAFNDGLDNLIKRVMQNPEMRKLGKPVPAYCQSLIKAGGPPDYSWEFKLEKETLLEAQSFLEKEMNASVEIIEASKSDHPKAKIAVPRRPGINFES